MRAELPADAVLAGVLTWIPTYLLHSTLLLGVTWLLVRAFHLRSPRIEERLWKAAVIGGIVTATLQGVAASGSLVPQLTITLPPLILTSDNAHVWTATAGGSGLERVAVNRTTIDALDGLALVCLVIGTMRGIRFGIGYRRLLHRVRRCPMLQDDGLEQMLGQLCFGAGVDDSVRLIVSPAVASPVALGRRKIYVPARALPVLGPAQQRAMLAHELAHVVRRDPLWIVALTLVERVLFFQPLNRLARRRIQAAAEYRCDTWAVQQTGDGLALARCLAAVAGWTTEGRAATLAGMTGGDTPVVRRVQRLLGPAELDAPDPPGWARLALVSALGLLVLVAPLVALTGAERHAIWSASSQTSITLQPADGFESVRR